MVGDLKTYAWVVFSLLILLGLAIGAVYVPLGPLGPVVSVTISIIKTILIVLFFMHVKHARGVVKIFAAAGFIWLGILVTLTLTDYLFRTQVIVAG